MPRSTRFIRGISLAFLILLLAVVYRLTLAPGLTWANHGADGGDLIAAAATGGVAHPTGYPVYLLAARAFQMIPVGTLAFRTNLFSACATILAASLLFQTMIHLKPDSSDLSAVLTGLISAFAFGFSPLIWSQAVITEVHALHGLFVALLILVSTDRFAQQATSAQLDCAFGLTFGLAMGNHMIAILLFPIMAAPLPPAESSLSPRTAMYLRPMGRRIAWMGIGLATYLSLPLRSLSHPPVNWGNPITLNGFMWLVTGNLYQDLFLTLPLAAVWERSQAAAALLLDQFGLPGLALGLSGLVFFFRPSRWNRLSLWIMGVHGIFAVIYGADDSFLYLIPAFLCFAVWIGLGYLGMANSLSRRLGGAGTILGLSIILYLFVISGTHWPEVDASADLRAEQFGRQVLAQAPLQALVFVQGDRATFTMWYFHYALHERPDLVFIATDLLPFEWYQDILRNTYPDLVMPDLAPFPEVVIASNPGREVCNLDEAQTPALICEMVPGDH